VHDITPTNSPPLRVRMLVLSEFTTRAYVGLVGN
jgi:hypothetical protein